MRKPKISVAIATFNEEKNIGPCLDSVRQLADEIIVVDGGSTDKTVEIAKRYTTKVIVTDNPPIFHINKQKAIDAATRDWILQLDADEMVTPELGQEIKKIIDLSDEEIKAYQQKLPERKLFLRHQRILEQRDGQIGRETGEYAGFFVSRLNYFLGKYLKYGGVYPDGVIRLVKRGKAHFPCQSVHEQIVVNGKVGWLKNSLFHLADPTFKRYLERNSRYIDLIVKELQEEKVSKNPLQYLNYTFIKPINWFFMTLLRHKGILDGFQGIIFSFFSALRFPRAYWRYLKGYLPHLLVVLVFSTYVLPYPGLMPGNRFYRLEQIADRIGQFWAFGSFSRHKYELNLADKKLVEAKILFEYQQYPLALKALTDSNKHFQKAVWFLDRAEKEGKNISQKKENLKAAAEKHKEVLERLKGELPNEFLWQPEKKPAEKLKIYQSLEEAIKNREV